MTVSDISTAVEIEDISAVKKKLSFNIPWADVKSELDKVYKKIGKKAKIKGFRPGKTPRAIIERFYREQAEEDAVSNLVNRSYWETLQKRDIFAVTQPQIEQQGIEAEKDFAFTATVEVEPLIEPKDYLGLELQKSQSVVTEEDLQTRLQEISQMFATIEDVIEERGIVAGDFANLDFSGEIAGESLKELAAQNYMLEIGSGTFVPGFEEQLVGMQKNETRTVSVTFPENYNATHLAGKEVVFTVHLNGIRIKRMPEIDDNFVKNFEKYNSLEALKDDVRQKLAEEKQQKQVAEFERGIAEKLLAVNEFEVPDSYVERQIYYMMSDMQRRMVSGGMDTKKAAEFSFKLHDQFREDAVRIVKTALLIKNIARKEALTVSEDELAQRIREMASQRSQSYDKIKESLEKEDLLDNIRSEILSRKTYAYLESKAQVTMVHGEGTPVGEDRK